MTNHRSFVWAAAIGLAMSLAGCSGSQGSPGSQGPQGPQGAPGAQGPAGAPGADAIGTGTISGALTTPNGAGKSPVPGATVSVVPDQKITTTTGADGTFSLTVPVGVYTVVFTKNPGIATTQVAGVAVVAGGTASVNQSVAYSPIALTVASDRSPAGFGAPVNLGATATGATGPVTYTWTLASGPYKAAVKPALTASGAKASFTTNSFAEMFASNVVTYPPLFVEPRPSFVPVSFNQLTQMSYTVTVTATDGTYSQTASTKVAPVVTTAGVIVQGDANMVPVGINLIANDPASSSWAWTLTPPAGAPAAKLVGADTQFPSFTPTAPGVWTLQNGSVTLAVTAATYLGMGKHVDAAADDSERVRCSTCHAVGSSTLPPQFAQWQTSRHRNSFFMDRTQPATYLFQKSVGSGTYSGECLACHAVGFTVPELVPEASPPIGNRGFADTMEEVGWSIPTVKTPTAWNTLPPQLKALVGDQCENCHGPMSPHLSSRPVAPSGTFSSATCLVCHDEPGHHEEPAWWVKSPTGHANTSLAVSVATRGADCARCHSAQGFAAWRKQIAAGVAGDLPIQMKDATGALVTADAAYLQSLGVDAARVQPQTCEACHDSHISRLRLPYVANADATQKDPFALKDAGDAGLLPAGFEAKGVGMGALCMTCHNGYSGAHGDGIAPVEAAGAAESAPHHGPQADMLMGQNAFFLGATSNLSKHAMIADTCVGCHMKFYPTSMGTVGGTGLKYGSGTNHTFKADGTVCVNCHPNATDTALQGDVQVAMASVRGAILAKVNAAIATLPAGGTFSVNGIAVDKANAITALDVTSSHGSKALSLTLATKPAGATSATITVLPGQFLVGGKPVIGSFGGPDGAGGAFADYTPMGKALWNYLLVASDGSLGVHNPSFALDVLSATRAKVASLTDGAFPY